jgi:hypothetical protein
VIANFEGRLVMEGIGRRLGAAVVASLVSLGRGIAKFGHNIKLLSEQLPQQTERTSRKSLLVIHESGKTTGGGHLSTVRGTEKPPEKTPTITPKITRTNDPSKHGLLVEIKQQYKTLTSKLILEKKSSEWNFNLKKNLYTKNCTLLHALIYKTEDYSDKELFDFMQKNNIRYCGVHLSAKFEGDGGEIYDLIDLMKDKRQGLVTMLKGLEPESPSPKISRTLATLQVAMAMDGTTDISELLKNLKGRKLNEYELFDLFRNVKAENINKYISALRDNGNIGKIDSEFHDICLAKMVSVTLQLKKQPSKEVYRNIQDYFTSMNLLPINGAIKAMKLLDSGKAIVKEAVMIPEYIEKTWESNLEKDYKENNMLLHDLIANTNSYSDDMLLNFMKGKNIRYCGMNLSTLFHGRAKFVGEARSYDLIDLVIAKRGSEFAERLKGLSPLPTTIKNPEALKMLQKAMENGKEITDVLNAGLKGCELNERELFDLFRKVKPENINKYISALRDNGNIGKIDPEFHNICLAKMTLGIPQGELPSAGVYGNIREYLTSMNLPETGDDIDKMQGQMRKNAIKAAVFWISEESIEWENNLKGDYTKNNELLHDLIANTNSYSDDILFKFMQDKKIRYCGMNLSTLFHGSANFGREGEPYDLIDLMKDKRPKLAKELKDLPPAPQTTIDNPKALKTLQETMKDGKAITGLFNTDLKDLKGCELNERELFDLFRKVKPENINKYISALRDNGNIVIGKIDPEFHNICLAKMTLGIPQGELSSAKVDIKNYFTSMNLPKTGDDIDKMQGNMKKDIIKAALDLE